MRSNDPLIDLDQIEKKSRFKRHAHLANKKPPEGGFRASWWPRGKLTGPTLHALIY